MTPAAHVTEDGIVWHQNQEKPLDCFPNIGEFQDVEKGVGGWTGEPLHRSSGREDERRRNGITL